MRRFMTQVAAVPLALIAISGAAGIAHAQQSADAIINALKPSGNVVNGATRGIKLGGSPAAQAPSAARPASTAVGAAHPRPAHEATTAPVAGPSVNLTVNFPTGSAELTPAAKASLDGLGKALASSDLAKFRFRIEGHTDNVGSPEANRALSQQRAEAVVSYLSAQYGVAAARLEPVGMGQDRPLIATPPQTPEARNRRVQVINVGA